MKKRVFFAISLPSSVEKELGDFFENTKKIREVRWEKPEKLHLTLAFLGHIEENNIPILTTLLRSMIVNHKPFLLRILPRISGFPTAKNPRVLWLEIAGDLDKLSSVAESVQKVLKDSSLPFDKRPFSAHLTVGRFRDGVRLGDKQKVLGEVFDALPQHPIEFKVTGVILFESKPSPKGSVYQALAYENFRD